MNIELVSLRSALSEQRGALLTESSKAFLDRLNPEGDLHFVMNTKAGGALPVFFIESGGSEAPFRAVYSGFPSPYYLLAKGDSNSLASALEILSFLHQQHLEGEILYGDPKGIHDRLLELGTETEAKRYLAFSRLGIIGEPSDWLIASDVDFGKVMRCFGIQMMKIPFSELSMAIEIEKKAPQSYPLPTALSAKAKDPEVLIGALTIYGALKRLIRKYHLNGFSLRCFDLLGEYRNTACLALAMLNSEGISAGCEGDETSLISMHIFRSFGLPSFQSNPSVIDLAANSLILAHCTVPFQMTGENVEFMTHYESGLGIGIRGKLSLGKVTLFKLNNSLTSYHLFTGTIEENLTEENLCRTQVRIKADSPLSSLLTDPYGNHLLVAYGDERKAIQDLLRDCLGK
jgi:L-fucose isomerase-like protein